MLTYYKLPGVYPAPSLSQKLIVTIHELDKSSIMVVVNCDYDLSGVCSNCI